MKKYRFYAIVFFTIISVTPQLHAGNSRHKEVYQTQCGDCHVAYPTQLLPVKSWQTIMAQLDDHFGDTVELDDQTIQEILSYIKQEDKAQVSRDIRKMIRKTPNPAPLRITELPRHIKKHEEIPERMIQGNRDVGSLSQCDACHQDAEKGDFEDDDASIPNFPDWHSH